MDLRELGLGGRDGLVTLPGGRSPDLTGLSVCLGQCPAGVLLGPRNDHGGLMLRLPDDRLPMAAARDDRLVGLGPGRCQRRSQFLGLFVAQPTQIRHCHRAQVIGLLHAGGAQLLALPHRLLTNLFGL